MATVLPTHQIFGIHELYRPENETPEIDIVAVHGLNGDAIKTWTCEPSTKGSERVCWLNHQDLLQRYVKRARVLTWGYNANILSLKGKTGSDRILQHAQSLVQQLYEDRELEGAIDRPIIFLCHSLGGIIVKRALAYSESRTEHKISHLHSIFTCTYAIVFFGTPHHGSSKARLLGNIQKMAALAFPKAVLQTESNLVKALEEDSEVLQNITDQFVPLMRNFRIFFLWEQRRTDLIYGRDYVVEERSAAPILPDTERCGIAADHRGMCRFQSNTDQGFRTVVGALSRYCKAAPSEIRVRYDRNAALLGARRREEAMELVRAVQGSTLIGNNLNQTTERWVVEILSALESGQRCPDHATTSGNQKAPV